MTSKENIHLVTSTRTWQVVGEWRGEREGEGRGGREEEKETSYRAVYLQARAGLTNVCKHVLLPLERLGVVLQGNDSATPM